jgi:hypothetical protein
MKRGFIQHANGEQTWASGVAVTVLFPQRLRLCEVRRRDGAEEVHRGVPGNRARRKAAAP